MIEKETRSLEQRIGVQQPNWTVSLLRGLRPGQSLCYYRGVLEDDMVRNATLNYCRVLTEIRQTAVDLEALGRVQLFQVPHGTGRERWVEYFARGRDEQEGKGSQGGDQDHAQAACITEGISAAGLAAGKARRVRAIKSGLRAQCRDVEPQHAAAGVPQADEGEAEAAPGGVT